MQCLTKFALENKIRSIEYIYIYNKRIYPGKKTVLFTRNDCDRLKSTLLVYKQIMELNRQ